MILVSRSAARAIFTEIQRWVELGLEQASSAYEALVYPLSALFPVRELLCPLELAGADHLRALVVDDVAIPPDPIKSFSPANCHFAAADLASANRRFNEAIDRQLGAHPRLGVHSKLHSHPFPGGSFLSGGDMQHGVLSAEAVAWRRSKGLRTAILHVVYPDATPRPSPRAWRVDSAGALAETADGARRVRWRLHSWASGRDGTMQDLGDAEVVSDGHPLVRVARKPPYWRSTTGSRWCDAQKAALREAGYAVSRNLLGRGWRRYLVSAGGRQLLIALPPDLPAAPPRLLEVRNALADDFALLPLPAPGRAERLSQLSLLKLVRYFGAPSS